MRLDFSDVKETKMAVEGQQELTIAFAEERVSKNGTNMLSLMLKDQEGGIANDNVCLEGAGAFKAKQLEKALGLSDEEFAAMEASELVGLVVTCEVVHEEYEGKESAKVKKYIA